MTAKPILIDGYQFFKSSGTGIATYVRTLSSMLKASGCSVSVLYGRRYRPKRKLSRAAAAAVFSHEIPHHGPLRRFCDYAGLGFGLTTSRALRAHAVTIDTTGVDLHTIEPPLPNSNQILNADRLYWRAHRAFQVSGRFTELSEHVTDGKFAVAHWTAPLPVRMRGVPNVYTLHDLVPLRYPHFVLENGVRSFQMHEIIAREADHIITVSQASRQDIIELLQVPDDRVSVTYQPVPMLPVIDCPERIVEMVFGVKPGQYALYLGAIEPKKNIKRLIESYVTAGVDCPLLLAGPLGWLYDEETKLIDVVNTAHRQANIMSAKSTAQALAAANGADLRVRQLGYLPRRHVIALLKCAKFFVFPSICEGFGLPVLEAMQLGVPVLTSNTSALPEIAGDTAVFVDPMSVDDIASGLRQIDADADLRGELSRKGPARAAHFSPDYCQSLLSQAYSKIGISIPATRAEVSQRASVHGNPTLLPLGKCADNGTRQDQMNAA